MATLLGQLTTLYSFKELLTDKITALCQSACTIWVPHGVLHDCTINPHYPPSYLPIFCYSNSQTLTLKICYPSLFRYCKSASDKISYPGPVRNVHTLHTHTHANTCVCMCTRARTHTHTLNNKLIELFHSFKWITSQPLPVLLGLSKNRDCSFKL
jgi:hypothetical protein